MVIFSAGVPLVCGGATEKCYTYNFAQDTWTQSGSMPHATRYPGYDYSPSWGLGTV
jgi:hypothetical protein